MRARIGDRLVAGSGSVALIVGVPREDGQPPYVVRWLRSGHIAMVTPDSFARILPAEHGRHGEWVSHRPHAATDPQTGPAGEPGDSR